MNTTARIMVSPLCNKCCSYCCNHHPGVIDRFKVVNGISELYAYDNWCITGGEPMLFPDTVRFLVSEGALASVNVYLYTAQHTKELEAIIPLLNGITYTVHATANLREINDFVKLQTFLVGRKGNATFCNSHRLLIDPEVAKSVHIEPEIWDNVELAVWKSECDINPGEDFVRLSSPLDFSIKTHSSTKVLQRVGINFTESKQNENE